MFCVTHSDQCLCKDQLQGNILKQKLTTLVKRGEKLHKIHFIKSSKLHQTKTPTITLFPHQKISKGPVTEEGADGQKTTKRQKVNSSARQKAGIVSRKCGKQGNSRSTHKTA